MNSLLKSIYILSIINFVYGVTVREIRHGSVTLGNNDESRDVLINPPIQTLASTFALCTCTYGGIDTGPAHVLYRLTSASNLRLERASSGEVVKCDYQIAEFFDGVSVQRGTGTSLQLNDVNPNSAFLLISYKIPGDEWDENDFKRGILGYGSNGVNVEVEPTNGAVAWQVVTCDACDVTRGEFTMAVSDARKYSDWAINNEPARTMLLSTYKLRNGVSDNSPTMCNIAVAPRLEWDGLTMRVLAERCTAGFSRRVDVAYEIVKWLDATVVTDVNVEMADEEKWVTAYLGPLEPSRTLLLPSVLPHIGAVGYSGTHTIDADRMGLGLLSCRIEGTQAPYAVNCSRLDSGTTGNNGHVSGSVQIVQFAGPPAPTMVPTLAPTKGTMSPPTSLPTRAPTTSPSKQPTDAPVVHPTVGPTVTPGQPSRAPTMRPTHEPTISTTSTTGGAKTTTKSGGGVSAAATSTSADSVAAEPDSGILLAIIVSAVAALVVCLLICLCLLLSRRRRHHGHVNRSVRGMSLHTTATSSVPHSRRVTPQRSRANSRPIQRRSRTNTTDRRARISERNRQQTGGTHGARTASSGSLGMDALGYPGATTTELVFTEYNDGGGASNYGSVAPAILYSALATNEPKANTAEPIVYTQLPS